MLFNLPNKIKQQNNTNNGKKQFKFRIFLTQEIGFSR